MRYIPTILNYIAKNSNQFHIWGFDEPENSCEYALVKELSNSFLNEYVKNSQIFVVTHSFHFISLTGNHVSRFRVCKDDNGINSKVIFLDKRNLEQLESEIGIIQINEKLSDLFDQYNKEKEEFHTLKEKLINSIKPIILFEGPSDNLLFSVAYKELKGSEISSKYLLCEHQTNTLGSTIGSSASDINRFLYSHITKTPIDNIIIAVFDFDNEGFNQFKALKKSKIYIPVSIDGITFKNILQHKDKRNIYAITLVPPTFRENFVHYEHSNFCYLTTELLLTDIYIPIANKSYLTLFDKSVFVFGGNKILFAEKIKKRIDKGEKIDFSGFNNSLNLIDKLALIKKY